MEKEYISPKVLYLWEHLLVVILQPVSTKEVPKQHLPVLRTNMIFLPGKHSFSNPPSPQLLEDLLFTKNFNYPLLHEAFPDTLSPS